jgi:hypothetical protein
MIERSRRNEHRSRAHRTPLLVVVAAALFAVTTGAALAQTATADTIPILYRLDKGSQYQQGCFGPCLCAVLISEPVQGTFVLTATGFDGLFTTYAVTDINWMVTIGGTDTFVTGSGTYKIGGEFALQQELALDLQVGDDAPQHFDSGLVTGPAPFPNISVAVSLNGQVCFDTVFQVNASPVPPDQIRPYRLLDGSTFQRGCFGACDCLIGPLQPIVGNFALVPLASAAPWNRFAVINARWRVLSSSLSTSMSDSIPVRGAGFYTFGGDGPSQQRLELLLTVNRETPARFDSGLVAGGDAFPRIDARISVNGAVCYDTVIDLHAAPRKTVFRGSERTDGDAP